MKPESADYLAKPRECLDAGERIAALPLPEVAAKEAYLAAYHAAHAFIFEKTGKVIKTQGGMRTMFALLSRDDPRIDPGMLATLGRAYKFNEIADYATGARNSVTPEESRDIIDLARDFINRITVLLS